MIGWAANLSLGAVLLATTSAAPLPAKPAKAAPASLCRPVERIVYSCRFGRKLGSVCATAQQLHYRFGPPGKPEIAISSNADWSNIHIWSNRSQAGLNQDQIRFTTGNTHYVVFAGETGALNERPGVMNSGIAVIRGASAEGLIATLGCKAPEGLVPSLNDGWTPPPNWTGQQGDDDPFNVIF